MSNEVKYRSIALLVESDLFSDFKIAMSKKSKEIGHAINAPDVLRDVVVKSIKSFIKETNASC